MNPKKLRKKNRHRAVSFGERKIKQRIKNYSDKYPTPKYLTFMLEMARDKWNVSLYEAGTVSKYVFLEKGELQYKVRFSNHKPNPTKEENFDCDYYVGVSNKNTHTTEEIINLIQYKFKNLKKTQVILPR